MPNAREQWLELTVEAPLEPGLPICDSHHHLWDRPDDHYLAEELLKDLRSGHRVLSTVFIETQWRSLYRDSGPAELRPIGETEFIHRLTAGTECRRNGVAAGIVGYADLTLGSGVARVLEGHLVASPDRFRGIRHLCTWDDSPVVPNAAPIKRPGLMADTAFRAGIACLGRFGLSFDAWLYFPQLPELAALARACPEVRIVLNHIGGILGIGPYAGKRDEVFEVWWRGIAELASCANVVVKLGGLGMLRNGFGWEARPVPLTSAELAQAMAPYYLRCIEKFGPDRCMFESNFPVDKVSYSYVIVWNAFKRLTRDFSAAERAALFHDTAARVYRLAAVTSPQR